MLLRGRPLLPRSFRVVLGFESWHSKYHLHGKHIPFSFQEQAEEAEADVEAGESDKSVGTGGPSGVDRLCFRAASEKLLADDNDTSPLWSQMAGSFHSSAAGFHTSPASARAKLEVFGAARMGVIHQRYSKTIPK
eukprot:Skav204147  [mRNA]  locus=scaffold903:105494:105898:- [translate_table: standard]